MDRKKLPLYTALAIPVLMIILVAGMIYLPGLTKSPKYNFIYMAGDNVYSYDYGYGFREYEVKDGRLTRNEPPPVNPNNNYYMPPKKLEPKFYLYDVAKNQATEINFSEAQNYKLDSGNTSPDGYEITYGSSSGGGGLLFGGIGGDYNSRYLRGHNRSRKLDLKLSGNSSYYNFQFLGWVEQ